MYVCQSVSWLTSLLKLDKYRDISCSWWDIFLKFFGHIPEMFVHFFWILTNFLYVCQSISWLTNLLKIGQYGDISCSGWDIFPKFLGDIPGIFWHYFQINANCLYVCQSVSWLTSLQILDKCRYISCSDWDSFLKFLWDSSSVCAHYIQINANCLYVCQSVYWLTSVYILNKCRDISCSERDIFLKFVWDISGRFAHYFKIITNFLFVCQSVS